MTTSLLNAGYSDFRNVVTIYDWVIQNAMYSDFTEEHAEKYDAYYAIVDGMSICLGFTNAVRYLLNRVGVECLSITSEDGSHMWNMVKIDDKYYHIDVTWGLGGNLQYFGMDDTQQRLYNAFSDGWFYGNPNFLKLDAPVCDSSRFAPLWQGTNYTLTDDGVRFDVPYSDEPVIWGWDGEPMG